MALEGQMVQLFSMLGHDYDIPIGLELDSGNNDLTEYRLKLDDGTLPELLDQFVSQNPKYDWFIENGVVNIFPRASHRDPFLAEILSLRLKSFAVNKGTSSWKLEELLFTSAEIKAVLDARGIESAGSIANFSGGYIPQLGRDFSLNLSGSTAKEILNHVVRESPLARLWVVSRVRPDGPLRITVSSRHQTAARND
ncbi:MAG TPA: hypothetical protein VFR78_00255 [Pyrinomonadaceae bacterium]|nr:hypothetical protein [Pyrinomonadaceae bacterium]